LDTKVVGSTKARTDLAGKQVLLLAAVADTVGTTAAVMAGEDTDLLLVGINVRLVGSKTGTQNGCVIDFHGARCRGDENGVSLLLPVCC